MLSAVIRWESSYPAMPSVRTTTGTPGIPSSQSSRTRDESPQISTGIQDRDRTVLRRSEPSSRTALTGEQPDPWDLLQPQDAMSRHRCLSNPDLIGAYSFVTKSIDYTFILTLYVRKFEIRNMKSELLIRVSIFVLLISFR
jgi:hypothetical protein